MFLPMPSIFKIAALFSLILYPVLGIGTGFLSLPASAQELALGQDPSAGSSPSANPALLGRQSGLSNLNISYGHWLGGVETINVSYLGQMQKYRTGLRIRHVGLDDLEFRTTRPSDEALAKFAANGTSIDLYLSHQWQNVSWGVSLRRIRMQIYTESSQGWAIDAGGVMPVGKRFSVGFSVLNMGSMNSFQQQVPELPFRVLAGAGFQWGIGKVSIMSSIGGESSSLVDGMIWRTGHQVHWRSINLSTGFQASKNVISLSCGFGLNLGIYRIQYGILFGSQGLGIPQMVDVRLRLP